GPLHRNADLAAGAACPHLVEPAVEPAHRIEHRCLIPRLAVLEPVQRLVAAPHRIARRRLGQPGTGEDLRAQLETAEHDRRWPCASREWGGWVIAIEVPLARAAGHVSAHADPGFHLQPDEVDAAERGGGVRAGP